MSDGLTVPARERTLHPSVGQHLKDLVFAPLRFVLSESPVLRRLGLSTLSDVRHRAAVPNCAGHVLDLTCGANPLKGYLQTSVVGADLFLEPEIDVCSDAHDVPFADGSFDTVVLLASLNYMHDPLRVLGEANRVLRTRGRIVVTMIAPWLGWMRVNLQNPFLGVRKNWVGTDRALGISATRLKTLLSDAGFCRIEHRRFLYGANNLVVGHKGDSLV